MAGQSDKPLPFQYSLAAGAIAGVTEILAMYPLDVVKTRFQIQVGNAEYSSIADCFRKIVRSEGCVCSSTPFTPLTASQHRRSLSWHPPADPRRGAQASNQVWCQRAVQRALRQQVWIQAEPGARGPDGRLGRPHRGCRRLNARAHQDPLGKYKGSSDVFKHIIKQEGVFGLARGIEATMWRHATWNGGYFGVISGVRSVLPKAETKQGVLFNNFIAGAIGGTVGTMINTPFDVAKTRIQSQINAPFKYNWTLPAIATVAREEGVRALYKGFVPKVLRLGPGGGILLVVFDFVSGYIRKYLL